MIWLLLTIVMQALAIGVAIFLIQLKANGIRQVLLTNVTSQEEEKQTKLEILDQLAEIALGCANDQLLEKVNADVAKAEEDLRAEKGKITITQAELEAVETRLRELEEIERELQTSSIDAAKELEMLQAQSREISLRNEKMKEELDQAVLQLDMLISQLASSQEATTKLTEAKTQLTEAQEKCFWYDEQISILNSKYMELKKAYDALDIEYAQLYEKQSSM